MEIFGVLAGLDAETVRKYRDLAESAVCYIESKLAAPPQNTAAQIRCEHAAAAVALYDYTLSELLQETTLVTAEGKLTTNYKESARYQAALALRNTSLEQINDLTAPDAFFFEGVGRI